MKTDTELSVDLSFDQYLVANLGCVDAVVDLLREMAPKWAEGLHLSRDGKKTRISPKLTVGNVLEKIVGERGQYYKKLVEMHGEGPFARASGLAEFKGADASIVLMVRCDAHVYAGLGNEVIWGNRISLDVRGERVEGLDAAIWVRRFFAEACRRADVISGVAMTPEEFDAKSMDLSYGAQAVGVDRARAALRGIYWLNFIGARLASIMELDLVALQEAERADVSEEGVLLSIPLEPSAWDTEAYEEEVASLTALVGEEFVFSKETGYDGKRGLPDAIRVRQEVQEVRRRIGQTLPDS